MRTRMFMLLAVASALWITNAGSASADCARVHVWLNYEAGSPQDVANECPPTPFPTAFDVERDTEQSGTVPPGKPNGAGVYVSVPLPEPWLSPKE